VAGRSDDPGQAVEVEQVADQRFEGGHVVEAGRVEEFGQQRVCGVAGAAEAALLLPLEVVVDEGDGGARFGVGGGGLLDDAAAEVGQSPSWLM
jgi:hypothetical protein